MDIKDKNKAVELIYNSIPYSKQIKDLDLNKSNCIYFTWRSSRYKLELSGSVWKVAGDFLEGGDSAILIERLIELENIKTFFV